MIQYHVMSTNAVEIIQWVLVAALAIAVVTDISKQKVYNWLTFPLFAIGFILNYLRDGAHGLVFSVEGVGFAMLSLVLFILGGMGAGDVKLFCAIGALMGLKFTMYTLLWTAITGGVIGLVYALKKGELTHTVKNALIGGHIFSLTHDPEAMKGMVGASKVGKIPYAPAIAIGSAIAFYILHKGAV